MLRGEITHQINSPIHHILWKEIAFRITCVIMKFVKGVYLKLSTALLLAFPFPTLALLLHNIKGLSADNIVSSLGNHKL